MGTTTTIAATSLSSKFVDTDRPCATCILLSRCCQSYGYLLSFSLYLILVSTSKSQRLPPRRRIRIKHRLLRKTRHASTVTRLQTAVVVRSVVHRDPAARMSALEHHHHLRSGKDSPVIPQRTRPRRPPKSHLNINITLINLIQILQNHIALSLIKTDDALRHRAVDEQALPARDRVHTDERVAALNVLGPCVGVVAVEVGVCRAVDGVAAVDDLAEFGREFLVGGVAGGPERVAADAGDGVVVEVGYACWLVFVDAGGLSVCWIVVARLRKLTDQCANLACRQACGNSLRNHSSSDPAKSPSCPASQAHAAPAGEPQPHQNTFQARAASAG